MTIYEAIEILNKDLTYTYPVMFGDLNEAITLGIEALKRCKVLAENSPLWRAKPLPGETPPSSNPYAEAYLKHMKESPLGREPK